MAFPTQGVLDNFNRGDEGPPPSGDWAHPAWNGNGGLEVVSNQCAAEGAGYNDSYWDVGVGPDCEVYVTIPTLPADGEEMGLFLRAKDPGAGGLDGYEVYMAKVAGAGNDVTRVYRLDNEALTQLGADITQEFAAGEKLGFEAVGSTLTVYQYTGAAWGSLGSRDDATYGAAGYIGVELQNTTVRVDDFGGGTIGAAAALPVLSGEGLHSLVFGGVTVR